MEGWHATRDLARVPVVRLDDAERVFWVRHVRLDGTVKRVPRGGDGQVGRHGIRTGSVLAHLNLRMGVVRIMRSR